MNNIKIGSYFERLTQMWVGVLPIKYMQNDSVHYLIHEVHVHIISHMDHESKLD